MLIGIVGKPNVGKSTFFKSATLAEVSIASYPFTTIKANEGIGFVKTKCPESEFNLKCKPNHGFCLEGYRFIPVKIIDVAGLVPGAHKGKGLGNKFLDDLRQADCLIHIVDSSGTTDQEGKKTENYDPSYDILFLEKEIEKWLQEIVGENWLQFARKVQGKKSKLSKELAKKLSGLKISEDHVKEAMRKLDLSEFPLEWKNSDLENFVKEIRKLSKPMIIAANKIDLPESEKNLEKLKKEFPSLKIIPCSSEMELALREAAKDNLINYIPGSSEFEIVNDKLNEKQKKALEFIREFLKKNKTTGVQDCLNEAVFSLLKYIVVYPVENENKLCDKKGNILPDAHLLPEGSTALDLAYAIHSEIGENFVSAIDVRTKRRLAKDYLLRDKDIIRIITN